MIIVTNTQTFNIKIHINECLICGDVIGFIENYYTCNNLDLEIHEIPNNCIGNYIEYEISISNYYDLKNDWTLYLYCDTITSNNLIYKEVIRFQKTFICNEE